METFKIIPFTTALKKMKYLCRKCKKKMVQIVSWKLQNAGGRNQRRPK